MLTAIMICMAGIGADYSVNPYAGRPETFEMRFPSPFATQAQAEQCAEWFVSNNGPIYTQVVYVTVTTGAVIPYCIFWPAQSATIYRGDTTGIWYMLPHPLPNWYYQPYSETLTEVDTKYPHEIILPYPEHYGW